MSYCSQVMLRMTSFSENEMNIQIPFCNVWHLNGNWETSLKQKHLLNQKVQNTNWETIIIVIFEILNAIIIVNG